MENASNQDPAKVEAALRECRQLTQKILLGLSSKRSNEEWGAFETRTIEMFRQKGLFKKEAQTEPTAKPPHPEATAES